MISKIVLFLTILSAVGVGLILSFTSPSNIGPIGIFGLFAMMYILFIGLISFFLYGVLVVFRILTNKKSKDRKITFKIIYYYSTVLAFAPIFFIAQQSIGRVGFFEFALIVIFEIIACIYISKR